MEFIVNFLFYVHKMTTDRTTNRELTNAHFSTSFMKQFFMLLYKDISLIRYNLPVNGTLLKDSFPIHSFKNVFPCQK